MDPLAVEGRCFAELSRGPGRTREDAMDCYRKFHRAGHRIDAAPAPPASCRLQHEGDTTKFLIRHDDGLETESVILPHTSRAGRPRKTLCVSSQVGCALGCTFCETAQMGLMKHLTPEQIVGQWYVARHELGVPITNIVFMGMGEPLDNVEAVIQAIRVLTDRDGPCIAASRIGVSTVGHVAGLARLAELVREEGFHRLGLAVSVNAPNDAIRSRIMPINRAANMATLRDALMEWPGRGTAPILVEYVVIPGVNETPDHARELCEYLRPLQCKLNVIPYNPRRDSPWPAPSEAVVDAFIAAAVDEGQLVRRRVTMGRSVMAACGQLGNEHVRGRKRVDAHATVGGAPPRSPSCSS